MRQNSWIQEFTILEHFAWLTRLIGVNAVKENEATLIAKALGDPSRFSIYRQIAEGDEVYCGEVCDKHALSPGTVSHHLKVLTDLGLITSRKEGLNVYYRSIPEKFSSYLAYLQNLNRK